MKGRISLRDFIKDVRAELEQAKAEEKDAFFELQEVTLEVAFSLDISGKGAGKFIVVDLSGEAKASQSHKVVLKLQPYSGEAAPAGTGGVGIPDGRAATPWNGDRFTPWTPFEPDPAAPWGSIPAR